MIGVAWGERQLLNRGVWGDWGFKLKGRDSFCLPGVAFLGAFWTSPGASGQLPVSIQRAFQKTTIFTDFQEAKALKLIKKTMLLFFNVF